MKWLAVFIVLLCFLAGIVGAAQLTASGTYSDKNTTISLASNAVTFSDRVNGFSVSSSAKIDGSEVDSTKDIDITVSDEQTPKTMAMGKSMVAGGKSQVITQPDPAQDIHFSYIYTTDKSKETIILDAPHDITFDLNIPPGEQIVSYGGGYRIVGTDLVSQAKLNDPINGGIPAGIQIQAPTAVDSNGNDVSVWWTLDGTTLNLNIGTLADGGEPVYPLTIDPTYYLSAYSSYLVLLLHMNQTPSLPTTFFDSSPYNATVTNVGVVYNTTRQFGNASAVFGGNTSSYLQVPPSANFGTFNSNWTIVVWTNYNGIPDVLQVFRSAGNCWFVGRFGNQFDFFTELNEAVKYEAHNTSPFAIPAGYNQWVFGQNSSVPFLYVNGVNVPITVGTGIQWGSAALNGYPLRVAQNDRYGIYYNGNIDELAFYNGAAIPIGNLYPQLYEIGYDIEWGLPSVTASFSGSPTNGSTPLTVNFNDTSYGNSSNIATIPIVDTWDWGWGDGTANGTTQNPTHTYTTDGYYSVYLKVTNTTYWVSSVNTSINYITSGSYPHPPTAVDFVSNITYGNVPLPIKLTDLSNNATIWNWSSGDGNYSIIKNPTFTYNIAGTYTVNLTASNNFGNASTVSKTGYIKVNATGYPYASFTESVNTGSPGLLVAFTDTSFQGKVAGETYLWNFNDPLSTSPTSTVNGSVTHVYAYAGVYYPLLTITNSAGTNSYAGAAITVSVSQNQQNSWYAPSQVRFTFQNMSGSALSGILISATPQNMTAPPAWINTFFGVNVGVNLINTTVSGHTASDGAITMPMMQSILYTISINGTAFDGEVVPLIRFDMYPSQADYLFNVPTTISPGAIQTTPASNRITYSVVNTTYNATAQYYNVTYSDPTGGTANITYYVKDMNGTVLYTQTVTGAGANSVTFSQLVSNPNGGTITAGFYASQSALGTISDEDVVTFGNFVSLMGMAVPTWVEAWFALGLIVLVACAFSYFSVPVGGVILIGLTGYFVWGIKWLQPIYGYSAMGTGLMILGMWAAIKYIRAREDRLS
jgi:PKD repeat protein